MIDTHAHLNSIDFDKDIDEVLSRSFDKGVENILVVSADIVSSKKSLEISDLDNRIYASVGIHPEDVLEEDSFSLIENMAIQEKVVAIGETGLDFSRLEGDSGTTKKSQIKLFERHIDLARKLNKPLVLHNRESDKDFYEIARKIDHPAVLHCYTGGWEYAKKILDFGFMISFTGIITFPKSETIAEVVRKIPIDRIMVETDCPYLAPVPYRGKRSEPWQVLEVIKKIAEIKGISAQEVEEKTSTNAKIFFGI